MSLKKEVAKLSKGLRKRHRYARGRACLPCTACCTTLRVAGEHDGGLHKPSFTKCKHVNAGGCTIYGRRPRACRTYRCLWEEGFLPDDLRPDRCGLIANIEPFDLGSAWCVYEHVPGAGQRYAGRLLISALLSTQTVPVALIHERIEIEGHGPYRPTNLFALDGHRQLVFFGEEPTDHGVEVRGAEPGWMERWFAGVHPANREGAT